MKTSITLLTITMAGLLTVPSTIRAEDAAPPTPPGSTTAPEKPRRHADGGAERGPGPRGHMDGEARLKTMTEKLGLTQEQQDQIKAIQEKNGAQIKELMAKGRENLTDEDKAKLRELMKTQFEAVSTVLTPEQKEKMKELRGGAGRGPGAEGRKPGGRGAKPDKA